MAEEPASDDDDEDYHECELAPPGCGSGQSLASERQIEGDSMQFDLCSLAVSAVFFYFAQSFRLLDFGITSLVPIKSSCYNLLLLL